MEVEVCEYWVLMDHSGACERCVLHWVNVVMYDGTNEL